MREVEIHGVRVPAIGLGTWQLSGSTCYEAVRDALDIGYRHLDTAEMYGNEEEVGRALRDSGVERDEVFLTTKLWRDHVAGERVSPAVEASLRRLGVEAVDLLLIHWPVAAVPLGETLAAMEAVRERGLVRHIGVSNFTAGQMREAAGEAEVLANQVEYHPFLAQDEVLAVAGEIGAMVTAYSPLARGLVAGDEVLEAIARRHGKTPAQVALRWLVQQPRVSAVPRSASPERRRENAAVFDFALDDGEMKAVAGRARGQRLVDPPFAPDWG